MLTNKERRLKCLELSLFRPIAFKDINNKIISLSPTDDFSSTLIIAKIYYDFIKGKLDKDIDQIIKEIQEKQEKKKIFTVVK